MLDEKYGRGLGNLNPEIYQTAASAPSAFHDATVATSGVTNCAASVPSMCNNSIPGPSGLAGGQAGYLLTAGYDEVTGLGSLDVQNFINNFAVPKLTPTVALSLSSSNITDAQAVTVTVSVSASDRIQPTGTVTLSSASYTSSTNTLLNGNTVFTISAGSLSPGSDTLTATYTPDSVTSAIYAVATGSSSITVTSVPKITPSVTLSLSSSAITSAQAVTATVTLNGGSGNDTPAGTVTLTCGSYSSGSTVLANGTATISIAAGLLPAGSDTITAAYVPTTTMSTVFNPASGSAPIQVTKVAKITPTITVSPNPAVRVTEAFQLLVTINGGTGNQAPTGTVKLSSGTWSVTEAFTDNSGYMTIPAEALPVGNDSVTATYTPDAASALIYNSATGTVSQTVTKTTPGVTAISGYTWTTQQSVTVEVLLSNFDGQVMTGSVVLTGRRIHLGRSSVGEQPSEHHRSASSAGRRHRFAHCHVHAGHRGREPVYLSDRLNFGHHHGRQAASAERDRHDPVIQHHGRADAQCGGLRSERNRQCNSDGLGHPDQRAVHLGNHNSQRRQRNNHNTRRIAGSRQRFSVCRIHTRRRECPVLHDERGRHVRDGRSADLHGERHGREHSIGSDHRQYLHDHGRFQKWLHGQRWDVGGGSLRSIRSR